VGNDERVHPRVLKELKHCNKEKKKRRNRRRITQERKKERKHAGVTWARCHEDEGKRKSVWQLEKENTHRTNVKKKYRA